GGHWNAGLHHRRSQPGQGPRGGSGGRNCKSPARGPRGGHGAFARGTLCQRKGGHYRRAKRPGVAHLHGKDPGSQPWTGAAGRHGRGSPDLRAQQGSLTNHPRRGGRARCAGCADGLRLLPGSQTRLCAARRVWHANRFGSRNPLRRARRRAGCRRGAAEGPRGQPRRHFRRCQMNPVRASLNYPQVTIALTLMLVVGGVYALLRMPRREDPKIHVREGIVAAYYPGASVAEVENQVTQKIEQRLFKIEGVRREKTYSTSMNGVMFINLNLEDNLQDTEKFWSKLRLDMAELKKTDLPDGVQGPIVDYDFGDTVAVLLAIHSDHYGYRELKDYTERIESAIRRIRAVSKVKRIGEQKEEIDVASSLSRLAQYSVSADQVKKALEGRNMVHYAGAVPTEHGKPPIQTTGAFEGEEQIRRVMIDVSRTGQPVYIGDLA